MCDDLDNDLIWPMPKHEYVSDYAFAQREFGYKYFPGDKFCLWQKDYLIVIHPNHKPRIYTKGKSGYIEINPGGEFQIIVHG